MKTFDKIRTIRRRTRILVSLGDCAVTSNVPGMRNRFPAEAILHRAYFENAQLNQQVPHQVIPRIVTDLTAGSRIRQGRRVCPWMPAFCGYDLLCLD